MTRTTRPRLAAVLLAAALVASAAAPAAATLASTPSAGQEAEVGSGDPTAALADVVPGGAVDPVPTPVLAAQGTGDVVALTFDDGPHGADTAAVLDLLAENDVHAVFCVIGQNITAPGGAELLRRIVAEGHVLCNHSTSYADMGALTAEEVEADLVANLDIIRTALGDPEAPVPFFRAPNGSWGQTREVAVALGMQPLAVENTIGDWETQDEAVLTARLRDVVTPGELVLVHDGGGDRSGTVAAVRTVVTELLAAGWELTLPVGTPGTTDEPGDPGDPGEPGPGTPVGSLTTDFEDGLDGWGPRADAAGPPTAAVSTDQAHGGTSSALVSGRTSPGQGLGHDVTGVLTEGTRYAVSAWVRFADGQPAGDVWLSLAATDAGATTYATLGQFTGMSSSGWVQVRQEFSMPAAESALLYLETAYGGDNTSDFFVDDVSVTEVTPAPVQELLPLKDTLDAAVGVAVDSREFTGGAAELTLRHVDQLTSENFMKPEAWYDDQGVFRPSPEVDSLMRFAVENDLRVYGHTLVWHSQTPAWFFLGADGQPLTTSEADRQVLRDRMRTHIDDVAGYLADTYGAYGSENPIVAFDVVNEVVDDSSAYPDGLRRSEWYRVLGEEFVDLAFQYADEAFNVEHAAAGADHPVTLFINDYNTEQSGKLGRYAALVERLQARGVPIDGVGHQFHLALSTPVSSLGAALDRFAGGSLVQAVTELDVTTGTPVTEALLVDQGYYYRDAFRLFRAYEQADPGDLFSVSVWGLTDGRSWRSADGAPLLFDDALTAKPAYYGAVDGDLPDPIRTAVVFGGDETVLDSAAAQPDSAVWDQLPSRPVGGAGEFGLRWGEDRLLVQVRVSDPDADAVDVVVDGATVTVSRDGTVQGGSGVTAVTADAGDGWALVADLPLPGAVEGRTVAFDVRAGSGPDSGWNAAGSTGTLTLVEPLSTTGTVHADVAPTVDGVHEAAWDAAESVTTDTVVEAGSGAVATARTLWRDRTLYVLAEVVDPTVDVTGSDPWVQDSVELFLDPGNAKNGPYRYEDSQIRISADNVVSFGTGDEAFQAGRVTSATARTADGYVVEAAVRLGDVATPGSFHGFDVQVNDATAGARTAVRSWADPTGTGYQSTARWGVTQLLPATEAGGGQAGGGSGPGDGVAPGGTSSGTQPVGSGRPGGASAGPAGALPRTGADLVPAVAIALLLLGLGTGLALVARSGNRRPQADVASCRLVGPPRRLKRSR